MSATAAFTTILSGLTKPLTKLGEKYIDRKINKDSIKAKAQLAKQGDSTTITLTDAEWETVSKTAEQGTWKDEYITLIVTSPLLLILGGGVYQSYTGDTRLISGTIDALEALKVLGVDMGSLMYAVTLAAIGLKLWRS